MNPSEWTPVRLRIPVKDAGKRGTKFPSTNDMDAIDKDIRAATSAKASGQEGAAPIPAGPSGGSGAAGYLDTEQMNILPTEANAQVGGDPDEPAENPNSLKHTLNRLLTQADSNWIIRSTTSTGQSESATGGLEDGQHTDKLVRKIQIYDLFTVFMIIIGNGLGFFSVGSPII